MNLKSALNLALKLAFAIGLIYFLIHSGHLDVAGLWHLMTWPNILLALALSGVNVWMAAWRWIVLLRSRGFQFPFAYGLSLYLIGMFFNYALPGAVSGDLVRGYYMVQDHPEHKMDTILSVLIDRVLGLYSFFVFTFVAVICDFSTIMGHEKLRWIATLAMLLFLGMTVFLILGFSTRAYRLSRLGFIIERLPPLHRVVEGLHRFGENPRMLALSVGSSVFGQFFALLIFWQVGMVMPEPQLTWPSILFVAPMGFVITAIPIAPAGVGVGQVAFLYLFQTYLQSPTNYGATAITVFQLVTAVWSLLGVYFYLRRRKPHEFATMQARMESATT